MNNLRNIFIILIMLVFTKSNAISKEMIGVVAAGIGKISNQKNEVLISGSKIYFGDTIIVKEKSSAQILLLDETAITVGEKSVITIDEFIYDPKTKIGKISSKIKVGTIKMITGNISKQNPENLEVKLPVGVLGSRGTEFAVVTDADEKSSVVLLGPGPENTLGMIPGHVSISQGDFRVDITKPGFESEVF
jgi:hypothetical protein